MAAIRRMRRSAARALARPSPDAWVFLFAFLTYAFFYQGGGHNEAARFDSIRAFLETGSLSVDAYAGNSADLIRLRGSFYSSKAPGTFLIGAPVFWAVERALRLLPTSVDLRYHLACYATTVLTIGLAAALGAALVARVARALGSCAREAAAIALTLALGTALFPFATLFMSHAATAAVLFGAFALAFRLKLRAREARPRERWTSLFAFGALLGFACALEYPAAIGAVVLFVYAAGAFWRPPSRIALGVALPVGALAGALPMAWHNWIAFKDVFYVPYEAYRSSENDLFQAHRAGVLGVRVPVLEPSYWPQFFSHLWSITFAPIRGLFYGCPALLLALPGFAFSLRRRAPWRGEAAAAAAMLGAYLAFTASFGDGIAYWGGGASYGPRHALPAFFFCAIPIVLALRARWARRWFAGLAALSVFFCLMATAVEPRAPYSPGNPIFGFYAPRFFAGDLAANALGIFSDVPVVGQSVAFNWGKLMGLPGQLQLLPLFALWIGVAFALDRSFQDGRRGFVRAAATFSAALAFLQALSF